MYGIYKLSCYKIRLCLRSCCYYNLIVPKGLVISNKTNFEELNVAVPLQIDLRDFVKEVQKSKTIPIFCTTWNLLMLFQ